MLSNNLHLLHGCGLFANGFWRPFLTLLIWLPVLALVRHDGLLDERQYNELTITVEESNR